MAGQGAGTDVVMPDPVRALESAERRIAELEAERDVLRVRVNALEAATPDDLLGLVRRLILSGYEGRRGEYTPTYSPLTHNVNEGMDDGCWFCSAPEEHTRDPRPGYYGDPFATHDADCPWVEAMGMLGLDIAPHKVKAQVVVTGGLDERPAESDHRAIEATATG